MTIEDRDGLGMQDGQNLKGAHIHALYKATLQNGVLANDVASTALKATQKEAGADMSVDVQLGSCIINGTVYTEGSDVNVAIAAAHATDERIDLIVYDVTATNPAAITGTPHATDPQVPDLTDDDDIPLAYVYVLPQDDGAYTGTIVDAYIYDLRCFVNDLWRHSSDYTKIDGADLYTGTVAVASLADAVQDAIPSATATVAAESGDDVVVTIDMKDLEANALSDQCVFTWWLSDVAGQGVTATAPSGGVAYTKGYNVGEIVADVSGIVITDSNGDSQLTFTEAGALTLYFNMAVNGIYIAGSAAMEWTA